VAYRQARKPGLVWVPLLVSSRCLLWVLLSEDGHIRRKRKLQRRQPTTSQSKENCHQSIGTRLLPRMFSCTRLRSRKSLWNCLVFQLDLKSCLAMEDSPTWQMITSWHAAELMTQDSDGSQLSASVILGRKAVRIGRTLRVYVLSNISHHSSIQRLIRRLQVYRFFDVSYILRTHALRRQALEIQ